MFLRAAAIIFFILAVFFFLGFFSYTLPQNLILPITFMVFGIIFWVKSKK